MMLMAVLYGDMVDDITIIGCIIWEVYIVLMVVMLYGDIVDVITNIICII